jgi:hypothetical protein
MRPQAIKALSFEDWETMGRLLMRFLVPIKN